MCSLTNLGKRVEECSFLYITDQHSTERMHASFLDPSTARRALGRCRRGLYRPFWLQVSVLTREPLGVEALGRSESACLATRHVSLPWGRSSHGARPHGLVPLLPPPHGVRVHVSLMSGAGHLFTSVSVIHPSSFVKCPFKHSLRRRLFAFFIELQGIFKQFYKTRERLVPET